uniref:Triosephosphate isomerase n=1 Tax=Hirondellea gigas TaxID=1518452 RepID=A0A6A7GE28_9CRUS
MPRSSFVGGNWKCNGTCNSVSSLTQSLSTTTSNIVGAEVVVAPSTLHLPFVFKNIRGPIQVCAQNISSTGSGAFTGEISAEMLHDFGIRWVILGHSERRKFYHESDELIGEKVRYALLKKLSVIACVGESLEERKNDETTNVVTRQLKAISDNVSDWSRVVIAYEPVWAIGTGEVATPEQAQTVHETLREWISKEVSSSVAEDVRIIYGGSVKPGNSKLLFEKADIDGFLVGGASLKAEDFAAIIKSTL